MGVGLSSLHHCRNLTACSGPLILCLPGLRHTNNVCQLEQSAPTPPTMQRTPARLSSSSALYGSVHASDVRHEVEVILLHLTRLPQVLQKNAQNCNGGRSEKKDKAGQKQVGAVVRISCADVTEACRAALSDTLSLHCRHNKSSCVSKNSKLRTFSDTE